ncbi:hypothetical protein KEM54_000220 [Ascosphaera aggregata]|nr:hypothetical protein KEM54_000220 [Ascosphaera aggregata]
MYQPPWAFDFMPESDCVQFATCPNGDVPVPKLMDEPTRVVFGVSNVPVKLGGVLAASPVPICEQHGVRADILDRAAWDSKYSQDGDRKF